MSAWSPKRFSATHLRIVRLHWCGLSGAEIAASVGVSPQTVSNVINSEQAKEILDELTKRSLDTVLDVQTDAQALAPAALEVLQDLMFTSKDDRVRKTACTDILAIAGHQPVRRIAIERPDPATERYRDMSEKEIRDLLMKDLGVSSQPPEGEGGPTVH